jgi:hypothetical protein
MSVRQQEFECVNCVYCETILIGFVRIYCHVDMSLSRHDACMSSWKRVRASTQGITTDADTVDAIPTKFKFLKWDKTRVHACPSKPRSYFHGPLFLVQDDVSDASHRDLYIKRRKQKRLVL